MERYRYIDLLRVMAIGGVVYGHWLLADITYSGGRLSGGDAVDHVSWERWVTWAFPVMPVFVLAGGDVNGRSWRRGLRGRTRPRPLRPAGWPLCSCGSCRSTCC